MRTLVDFMRPSILGLDWMVAFAWTAKSIQWVRGLSLVPDMRQSLYAPVSLARLTVIVPACNEEKAIEACLDSLLASVDVVLEIIAVNDRSSDATGRLMEQIADTAQATPHSMRVVHIGELPAGWMGKTHAMALAAAQSTGEWLLFTDGDMLFTPGVLARALRFGEVEEADHIVLYPTLIFKTFGERVMLAFLHAVSIWAVRPWKVHDPTAKRDFIGVGAFNLMRRAVYDGVGGWGPLRMEVLEDLRMGYTIKQAGYRQRAVFGQGLTQIRWAEGAFGVVQNMTKNLFAIFRFHLNVAIVASITLFILCLLPFGGLALGIAGWGPCILTLVSLGCLYSRYHRHGLPGTLFVLTFPAGAVLFLFALIQSIGTTLLRRGVTWRGTFYPLNELRKQAGPLR